MSAGPAASAVGERVRLTVGAVAHGGHCIARHEGRAVFVRHALPGEEVVALVTEGGASDRFWRADAVEVLEASPDRVPSVWPEAGPGGVGGGELAHVALPAQREWKLAVLREAFERFAGLEFHGTVTPAPGEDERGGLRYRTRVDAVAGTDGRATMARHGTRERITLREMPLATPDAEEALLSAQFEPGTRFGVAAASTGEVRVWNHRDIKTELAPLTERVHVGARVVEYHVTATEFWQVHVDAPSTLLAAVLHRVDAGPVLDLYSGVGLFAKALAEDGREVVAVERFDPGGLLRFNLEPYPRAVAEISDAREYVKSASLQKLFGAAGTQATVVLDPPRSGAKRANIDAIVGLEPARIVYVACDPVALARDAATLVAHGYAMLEAQAFDLFPMTHHVETIATFERR